MFQLYKFEVFASLKAIDKSVAKPLFHYSNNLRSTINLLDVMSKHKLQESCILIFNDSF